ncbi:MAG: thioredoxin-dependent thiol peroxidase [Candidatus Aenigmarchaeota archaeon]|nr:thioredoxin-dependent thiol peroxidase [Candidatus Aenigmarchaeota archaeon]
MVKEGQKAPAFALPDESGFDVALSDFAGKRIVLYFYPRDMTPGCTIEACSFRDYHAKFKERGAVILGVSTDGQRSHAKFKEAHGLPFALLSDKSASVCRKYGVWKKKKFMGKEYMGIERTTFVIDEAGKISKIFKRVQPLGHWKEILALL